MGKMKDEIGRLVEMPSPRIAILGAGPAGVAAAWKLHRLERAQAVVVEQRNDVGGNAGSFELEGIPVDYGSHRLHPSCRPDILADIRALLGDDLLDRPRHGRIRLRGRWIHFPLKPLDLALSMPWSFAFGVAGDAVRKVFAGTSPATDQNFASVMERGLGTTICRDFYFPYALKVWGMPPQDLSAVQAVRRVSAGSLSKMARKVLALVPGLKAPGAGRFFYPRGGYGQISRSFADVARQAGAQILLGTAVRRVQLGPPHRVTVEANGGSRVIDADQVWSTIPITVLTRLLDPQPPENVLAASRETRYRAMILVYLVLEQPQFTPFDAHYFPETDLVLTRLSEPKNYSSRHEPAQHTVLCGELPCTLNDATWSASDDALAELVRDCLARCDLSIRTPVVRVVTRRLPYAYPIYLRGYEEHFRCLDEFVGSLENVLTFGRQGLFAHDNTHHTLAMAYAAVDCLRADGKFDGERWQQYRSEFETHVVED
jgi:protoporphyrinogen oxidase